MASHPEADEPPPTPDGDGDSDEPPALLPADAAGGEDAWEALDLREAGRFLRNEARAAQEAAWSGTNLDARQIWGAREAQRIYRRQLRAAAAELLRLRTVQAGVEQPESCLGRWMPPPLAARIADFAWGKGKCMEFVSAWQKAPQRPGDLAICVRKRPLLDFEAAAGEWDAVATLPRDAAVICHDGRLSRSGRQLLMTYRRFALDRAWGAGAGTEEVYRDAVAPLARLALDRGAATLLCMGQTGTGKTYTIRGVVRCLAADLRGHGGVAAEFFEIYGKRCRDLLAGGREVQLRSDGEDRVRVCGQRTVSLPGAEGLAEVLEEALKLRASEETQRNAASSRSHAVCTIRLGAGGVLRLVDLAGSERNFETTRMTAAQHRESAGINASLTVLKDCFRAHAANQRGERAMMPFRRSRLTRVLRDCFVDPAHRTTVIATVSPTATDTIHTVNTLRHATMLAKPLDDLASEFTHDIPLHLEGFGGYKDVPVIEWQPEHVQAWLREAENGRFAHVVVPPALTGKQLLQCSPQALSDLFEGALRTARADNEGEAWTVQVDDVGSDLGRELFAAARRTALAQSHAPGR